MTGKDYEVVVSKKSGETYLISDDQIIDMISGTQFESE